MTGATSSPESQVASSSLPASTSSTSAMYSSWCFSRFDMGVSSMPQFAPHPDSLGEHRRHELGQVAVVGAQQRAPAVEQRQLEQVAPSEVELRERLCLFLARCRDECVEAAELVDQLGQQLEAVLAVDVDLGDDRESG